MRITNSELIILQWDALPNEGAPCQASYTIYTCTPPISAKSQISFFT